MNDRALERHARRRTAHPALAWKIISLQRGMTPAGPAADLPRPLSEPVSQAEARVLRLLQTSLSAQEIACELYVSVNTVRTHMRHLYDKLGATAAWKPSSAPAPSGCSARPAAGRAHEKGDSDGSRE